MDKLTSITRPPIEWGVSARALPGQMVPGDMYLIKSLADGVLIAVVDGLGQGDEATAAARIAINTLTQLAPAPIIPLMHRCSDALTRTRGVVMTLAFLTAREESVIWLGVGNVEVLLRTDPRVSHQTENVLLRGGVLGYQMPKLQASVVPIMRNDLLILTTDGIRSDFPRRIARNKPAQQIADSIMNHCFKATDDALVLVVRYLGSRRE
jgi:negative regulator of sigma-B (phosphoserine phosphatase)